MAVAIAAFDAAFDAFGIDVDSQEGGAVHCGGQGLRAAHPAHAAGDNQFAQQVCAVVLFAGGGEGFVGALDNSLGADIDPASGGHLAVHD